MRRNPRDRRRAARDEGNEIRYPQRPFDDGVDLVADLNVFPVPRGRATRDFGQDLILDRDQLFLGPRVRDGDLAGCGALLHLATLEAHPRADELPYHRIVLVLVLLKDVVLHAAAAKIAGIGAIEALKDHTALDLVADA